MTRSLIENIYTLSYRKIYFIFSKYTITSSTSFTAAFILLLVVITVVYISIPSSVLTTKLYPLTDTGKINSAVICNQQLGNLSLTPCFLPDPNEVELYNEDSDFFNNPHQAMSTLNYKVHGTKLEAMKAMQMALKMKKSLRFEKAKRLFKHALTLQPLHPEVLNHYAEFLEENEDVVTADHLYVKVLILSPNHSRALVNRRRTMPLVEAMDREILERIDEKRMDLVTADHNHPAMIRIRKEVYFLHIHHTLALEGNTMSLSETRAVVETKTAIPGKSIKEHNEILGLESALRYMNKTLVNLSERLTIFDILEIHKRVLGHVDPLSAGSFRRNQVFVGHYVPPSASEVEYLMEQFVEWLHLDNMQLFHPVKRAALVHYRLAHIHPFVDGNGRTARLLMNLFLMRAGYPPVIIRKQDRLMYYNTLQTANEGDIRPFIRFIAHCTECTLDVFLNAHEYGGPNFKTLEHRMPNFSDAISL